MAFISSVLTCHDPTDDDCKVCRFLSGDRSQDTLLRVIEVLDNELAATEKSERMLLEALCEDK